MLVGKVLGPYVVDKELGSGAMGTVYRAKHKTSGERVAVKLMSPALGSSEQARARFVRELDILKQLSHVNIVRYKGSGRYHGSPFFIMEYVEGESLDHIMARRDRLTWEEIVDMGAQLCAALQHSHDKGIIHRDLKPSNVMVLRDGTVKLTDFGIAKDTDVTALTAANSTVGTAAYMSPEQCRGTRDITAKSDLYSLGVMLYELLTGRKPFTAETAMEMFLKHANAPFAPPSQFILDCPPWLNTIICQLMEKRPEQRPLNAEIVATALKQVKDKMTTQQSAAMDAAKKRRIDRTSTDVALDDKDKDAARAILGKKKKKKKAIPFYRQGWFTVTALALVAVVFMTGVYFVFIRAPSADSLYQSAEQLVKSEDDQKAARAALADFLYYYPDEPRAKQVQDWADQVDRDVLDKQMLNRRKLNFAVESDAEKTFRFALDNEDMGKLDVAAQFWRELLRHKTDKEQRPWALIGEKYLKELQEGDKLPDELRSKLQAEKKGDSPYEEIALDAMRDEVAGRFSAARESWEALMKQTETDREQRRWRLLAARKVREYKSK